MEDAVLVYQRAAASILEVATEGQDDAAEHQVTIRMVLTMLGGIPEAAKCLEDIPDGLFQDSGVTQPGTNEGGQNELINRLELVPRGCFLAR